jgi:hypothetical protein
MEREKLFYCPETRRVHKYGHTHLRAALKLFGEEVGARGMHNITRKIAHNRLRVDVNSKRVGDVILVFIREALHNLQGVALRRGTWGGSCKLVKDVYKTCKRLEKGHISSSTSSKRTHR